MNDTRRPGLYRANWLIGHAFGKIRFHCEMTLIKSEKIVPLF